MHEELNETKLFLVENDSNFYPLNYAKNLLESHGFRVKEFPSGFLAEKTPNNKTYVTWHDIYDKNV